MDKYNANSYAKHNKQEDPIELDSFDKLNLSNECKGLKNLNLQKSKDLQ